MNKSDYNKLLNNLPAFPGIQGRDKYFNSVVLVLLVFINEEYHFVFQKRAEHISQGGEICFPGGKYELEIDKDYKETAIRETMEELGVSREKVKVTGRLDTLVAPMGVIVDTFVGELLVSDLNECNINPDEVAEIFSIPVSFFLNNEPEKYDVRLEVQPSYVNKEGKEIILFPVKELGLPDKYETPWGGMKHRILLYKKYNHVIWGLTAELIYEVVKTIKS